MRILDLFSGIGGFSLAAQWCWGDELEIEAFVEIDLFCQKFLRKQWPGVPIYDDIKKIQWIVADPESRETIPTESRGLHPESRMEVRISRIDLLTEGFPCQPFSCAGKRAGTEDDRWVWPEMLRAIHEVKPRWIVAENVPGLLSLQDGMVFEGMCVDLEVEGYEVIPLIIPACAQGAPHRRDRVWIVGHSNGIRCPGNNGPEQKIQDENTYADRGNDHAPDPNGFNGNDAGHGSSEVSQFKEAEIQGCDSADPDRQGLQVGEMLRGNMGEKCKIPIEDPWQEKWYEVATRLCGVDDGIPKRMDRVNRLKALGNSIVPQIAFQIFRAIKG